MPDKLERLLIDMLPPEKLMEVPKEQQNSDNSMEIDSFYKIGGEKHIERIKPLTFSFNKLINVKEYYAVGDESLVAFETSEEKYFIGTSEVFNEFIKYK